MRKILWFFVTLLLAARLPAQTNAPVRLAIVVESNEASPAGDVLTADLSKNPQISLLERNEIDKVYREQGLSAANRDYLKLGQILGADGLWLFNVIKTPTQTNLAARLIAIKPGVVLANEDFRWPLDDISSWAASTANHLNALVPKLTVLAKDAIPISIVNLRSAIQSSEALEIESQLKTLTIQRLSQERQLFVLERQKMQMLSEEKDLKADDSAFWNSSYLLDGVVDQNGYSENTITVDGRLIPPNGSPPLLIAVSGSRTNLAEIVDRLARKVNEALKITSSAKEWNAADEAAQFLAEAQWAFKWGVIKEAQASADSAWALGKKDLDCAMVRVGAYTAEVLAQVNGYQQEGSIGLRYDLQGKPFGYLPTATEVRNELRAHGEKPFGVIYKTHIEDNITEVEYTYAKTPPDPKNIDNACHALELYLEFSRTSPEGTATITPLHKGWSVWHDSEWYKLGIENLIAASQVLQSFTFQPESQQPVADRLADLRALARTVARLISQSPSVRDSYFVGERLATHDELANTLNDLPNLFKCEVTWGCFWWEKPQDSLAFYREVMESPAFCYIHDQLWYRPLASPRLIAWNDSDRENTPVIWKNFVEELNLSTNLLWQLEGQALTLADADNDTTFSVAFTNFFSTLFKNREDLVGNNVDLLYLNWGVDDLVEKTTSGATSGSPKELLKQLFYSDYRPKLEAMESEYWGKTVPNRQTASVFEEQKQYLRDNRPFDFQEFVKLFQDRSYSKKQAAELETLAELYCSNMVAGTHGVADFRVKGNMIFVQHYLEDQLKQIINAQPASTTDIASTRPPPAPKPAAVTNIPAPRISLPTNILVATHFISFPKEQFPAVNFDAPTVFAHRMREDSLVLGVHYRDWWMVPGEGVVNATNVLREAIAIWRPNHSWEIIPSAHTEDPIWDGAFRQPFPDGRQQPTLFVDLFNNYVCVSDPDAIREYDLKRRQWQELPFSGQSRSQLFVVKSHLYASSAERIVEIGPDGESVRILASTRRRPVASALDSRESLGDPIIFEGPGDAPYVALGREVFAWNRNDWQPVQKLTNSQSPEIFGDVAFLNASTLQEEEIWRFPPLQKEEQSRMPEISSNDAPVPRLPFWKTRRGLSLTGCPAAMDDANIYFFSAKPALIPPGRVLPVENGRYADLVCWTAQIPIPLTIPLKFQSDSGPIPQETPWMACSSEFLFIGAPTLPGVWAVPKSEIKTELARQIRERTYDERQRQSALLAKYDLNHDGRIDSDERAAALADPAFLEFELDEIDANGNDLLDPEELAYFDVNKNGILEPNEEAAIHITQKLLASRLLKDNWIQDGQLDYIHLITFFGETPGSRLSERISYMFRNLTGSPEERLTKLLELRTETLLELDPFGPVPRYPLKENVERYWRRQRRPGLMNSQRNHAP